MTDQQAYGNEKRVVADATSVVVSDCAVALPQFSNNSRLDSGFQSGGSLASCNHQHSSYGQQQHSADNKQQQQQLAAHQREFNRLDSGLCEQIHDSLNISDVGEFGAGGGGGNKILSPLSSFTSSPVLSTQQQQLVSPHSAAAPAVTSTSKAVEDFFSVDADGDCQLHLAIADGATEIVFALIRMAPHPSFLDIQNNEMYAPLHIAVLVNQPAMVRRLVVAGAATDIRDREGNTPLHLAAKRGYKPCAVELLTAINNDELKEVSANSHRLSAANFILPPPQSQPTTQQSAHQPTSPQHHSPSALLDLKNYNGEHCIHLATFGQHYEFIWYLAMRQADLSSLEGRSGKTALHYAVNMGDERLVRLLATPRDAGGCGVWLNARDWAGRTALQCARINGDENIGKFLMSLPGCDVNIMDDDLSSGNSDEDFEFDADEEEFNCEFIDDIEVNGMIVNSIA
eukprot:TRINITY_DN6314_c0_g1_i2.p1 TRINITY_DN6314_c0_g1~~TRINITY_DN6314_c0_g1_i2.p1  ORF type:complete len:456 (-),score=145.78 TRINITY_DN6314_c0_g1_i2:4-1371(-)